MKIKNSMKIKNNLKTLLTAVLLLAFLWSAFFVTKLISKDSTSKNEYFIPENASFALKLDSRKLVNSTLFTVLFEGRDEKIIHKIKEVLTKPGERKKEIGINLLSDLVVFASPFKNGKLIGVSINLSNAALFEKNIPELLNEKQVVEVIGNVGIILTYISTKDQAAIDKREITSFFAKNILPLEKNSSTRFTKEKLENGFFQSYSKGDVFGNNTCFNSSDFQFNLNENKVGINGNLTVKNDAKSTVNASEKILHPKKGSFHFSSGIIPQTFQDTLTSLTSKLGYKIPEIKAISFNYGGINIVSDDNGMTVLPDLDLLLEFRADFSISDFLKNDSLLEKIDAKFINNQLIIKGKSYYTKQLSKRTVLIGSSKTPNVVSNQTKEVFAVKGNLSTLLKIEGGGMIVSFLEIIPAYRASKELFNNTEDIEITINKTGVKKAKLIGVINFKKEHYPMTEFLKFFLEIQFILM